MRFLTLIILVFIIACNTDAYYPKGGYFYPKDVADKDTNFYFYPLKDLEPKRDSFRASYYYLIFKQFDEPNLSIRPQDNKTFRLTYSEARGKTVIISLTAGMITIKKGYEDTFNDIDSSDLSNIEKYHLHLLQRRFPIDTANKSQRFIKYLDSMIKLYPQLLDPSYYKKLLDKTIIPKSKASKYLTAQIKLERKTYDSLVQDINSSGYWGLPYYIKCESDMADGYGFTLEANTKCKYNIVRVDGCPGEVTKFIKACQRIIEFAKMEKEISLI